MAPNNQTLSNNELELPGGFFSCMLLIARDLYPQRIYAAIYSDLSTDSALRTFKRSHWETLGFTTEVKTGKKKGHSIFPRTRGSFFNSSYDSRLMMAACNLQCNSHLCNVCIPRGIEKRSLKLWVTLFLGLSGSETTQCFPKQDPSCSIRITQL